MRCIACNGSGKMMGGGMITKNCDECMGTGKPITIDRESVKKKIRKMDRRITDAEAEKMIDDEMKK